MFSKLQLSYILPNLQVKLLNELILVILRFLFNQLELRMSQSQAYEPAAPQHGAQWEDRTHDLRVISTNCMTI